MALWSVLIARKGSLRERMLFVDETSWCWPGEENKKIAVMRAHLVLLQVVMLAVCALGFTEINFVYAGELCAGRLTFFFLLLTCASLFSQIFCARPHRVQVADPILRVQRPREPEERRPRQLHRRQPFQRHRKRREPL
jgi:hypothetical protein